MSSESRQGILESEHAVGGGICHPQRAVTVDHDGVRRFEFVERAAGFPHRELIADVVALPPFQIRDDITGTAGAIRVRRASASCSERLLIHQHAKVIPVRHVQIVARVQRESRLSA